jgi:hypothetical protein
MLTIFYLSTYLYCELDYHIFFCLALKSEPVPLRIGHYLLAEENKLMHTYFTENQLSCSEMRNNLFFLQRLSAARREDAMTQLNPALGTKGTMYMKTVTFCLLTF